MLIFNNQLLTKKTAYREYDKPFFYTILYMPIVFHELSIHKNATKTYMYYFFSIFSFLREQIYKINLECKINK
ncbi:MAG: hypothetical protein B6I20_11225 [Bacteroidetes bacterium 4572_117]|nr:MAG: hypothetical protein B6I20_11225 [Bacteroidetes bacterium 4572_117]